MSYANFSTYGAILPLNLSIIFNRIRYFLPVNLITALCFHRSWAYILYYISIINTCFPLTWGYSPIKEICVEGCSYKEPSLRINQYFPFLLYLSSYFSHYVYHYHNLVGKSLRHSPHIMCFQAHALPDCSNNVHVISLISHSPKTSYTLI